ncbi:MAG TPA: hypothetical protein VIJ25_05190, partial [Methylococcales bacterium]
CKRLRVAGYQLMWAHSHLMWFLAPGYYQLMWSRKTDVIGSCDLCYRAATARGKESRRGSRRTSRKTSIIVVKEARG